MHEIPDERLFPIQKYDYVTGRCADGRQVVMGLLCPHLVAFFFDPQGNLLGRERRPWDHPAPRMGADGPYMIYDDDFLAALERQRNDWQAEMGFQPRTIKVKAFFDADYSVGVELLPDHYQGLETADWFDDEDERREFMKSRDEWVKRGNFVWWWARDYHMSKNGKVEST